MESVKHIIREKLDKNLKDKLFKKVWRNIVFILNDDEYEGEEDLAQFINDIINDEVGIRSELIIGIENEINAKTNTIGHNVSWSQVYDYNKTKKMNNIRIHIKDNIMQFKRDIRIDLNYFLFGCETFDSVHKQIADKINHSILNVIYPIRENLQKNLIWGHLDYLNK